MTEEEWKRKLEEKYPFADLDLLVKSKLEYDQKAFEITPYQETFTVVDYCITVWVNQFFERYALCNREYAKIDLMKKDISEKVVELIGGKNEEKEILNTLDAILFIVGGLDKGFIPTCTFAVFDKTRRDSQALSDLLSLLDTFSIN